MGEGGVHVWRHDRLGRAEVGFVERGKAGDAEKREANRDLVFENLEEPYDPRSSGRGEAVDIETADRDRIGAQDHRLDDIGAAADPAIDDDAGAAADRGDDFRQHIDRAEPVIELAPAMVRHINAINAELDGALRILGRGDAFEDQRDVEFRLVAHDIAPILPRLVDAAVVDADAAALMALGYVALAPAVMVGVDRNAEGVVAGVDGAAEMVVDPSASPRT